MTALQLEQMEQVEGGSCAGAIALAIGSGAALATATGGWGIVAAVALAYGNADNVTEQCRK